MFRDAQLLTTADLRHIEEEEGWFGIEWAANGTILTVVYLWSELEAGTTKIRLTSARAATQTEIRSYVNSRVDG